jgi:serine O-acetyltransferase
VEDDVIIYSGTTILGRVRIGNGAVIGGNVWLDHDVAAGATVLQAENPDNIIYCSPEGCQRP